MYSTIYRHGQTVIPEAIRKRYNLRQGDQLVWLDDGQNIKVVPVPTDPIRALRGAGKGERLVEKLINSRQEDKKRGS